MLYERLEERVLFDAVPNAPVDADDLSGSGNDSAFTDRFEATASAVDVKVVADQSLMPQHSDPSATSRSELVIIDRSVEHYQQLVNDLLNQQTSGRDVHVATIDSDVDGVERIGQILTEYQHLDSLQIVSHGDPAGLQLGDVYLTADSIAGYAPQIGAWADSLSDDADILILGCDLASGTAGRDLLNSLQVLTGADVAASEDDTGYAPRGGDWDLEYLLGQTETTVAFSESIQSDWTGLLAPGPSVSIHTNDTNALIGETVQFEIRFDNSAAAGSGNVGYGPFVDVLMPANGADGDAGNDTSDGLEFLNATYLDQPLDFTEIVFADIDGAPDDNGTPADPSDDRGTSQLGYALHPYLKEVQSELQLLTLSGDIDGGQLGISFGGESTTIDLDPTSGVLDAATLQTALESLTSIGPGNVVVTNGSLPGEGLFVEFQGALAETDLSELIVDNSAVTLGGDDTIPRGEFAVNTITHGNHLPQATRIWGTPGDKLIVLDLPFGSMTPEQPEVDIVVNARVSTLADAYTPGNPDSQLEVRTRSGFRYGSDALDNIDVDPQVVSDAQNTASDWVEGANLRPRILTVETDILDWEHETASGPNHPRTFQIEVDLPEGQTITDLDITDVLPDSLVFLSLSSITSTDPTTTFTTNVPAGSNVLGGSTNNTSHTGSNSHPPLELNNPVRDQALVVTADQITGSAGTDVFIRFRGYVSEFRHDTSGNPDTPLIPVDGGPIPQIAQTGSATGNWLAADPRDQGGSAVDNAVSATWTSRTHVSPITTHKDVDVIGGLTNGYVTPGDILEYNIYFDISDYFTMGDVIFTDILSDGQSFYDVYDPANGIDYRPTFTLRNQFNQIADEHFQVHVGAEATPVAALPTDNFIVDRSDVDTSDNAIEAGDGTYTTGGTDPTSGETTITIDLSSRLQQLGGTGLLTGGHAADGDANDTNAGPSYGWVTFYTQVSQEFTDSFPSGDRSVDHYDTILNYVESNSTVRENPEDGDVNTVLGSIWNTSETKLDVEVGELSKEIYAINGNTTFSEDLRLQPGDRVTYRLSYTLPNSDFENLVLTDYLPLPAMVVDDFNADEVGGDVWTFDANGTFDGIAGTVELGPNDTFYASNPGASDYFSDANLSVDTVANSLTFDFGSYDDDASPSTEIDLLFTIEIQDDPFADGLYLTNIARATYGATNQTTEPTDALVKIQIGQPVLNIQKGVIATSDPAVVPSDIGPEINNEFQAIEYIGSGGGETVVLTFDGQSTGNIPVNATAAEIQDELRLLSTIGSGNVTVAGSRIEEGDIVIRFVGALAETDVSQITVSTNDASGFVAATISTELTGGEAIAYSNVGDATGFTGRITSDALDSQLIDADLLDVDNGLEAGDTVRFMVVVENTGAGANGAFDIQLRDQLPREFQYVAGSLSIVDGQGDSLSYTDVGTHPDHAFFGSGILLDDPGSTPAEPGGANGGALDGYSLHSGRNIAVITYDAILTDTAAIEADNVEYSEEITNNAVIVRYSGREGAEDHTPYRNEVQRLQTSSTPTSGTYTVTFEGETTAPIAWNATNQQVMAALEALSTIGAGNVLVAGNGISGAGLTLEFRGDLTDQNVNLVTVDDSGLTGATLSASTVTVGSFNEIQRITPDAGVSGGTYTLTFGEETTAPIAWDADTATITAALEALAAIPAGSVNVVESDAAAGAIDIEFTAALTQQNVEQLIVDGSALTGGTFAVATTRNGSVEDPRDDATVVIRGGDFGKSIVGTSEGHTSAAGSVEQVTVGEIVRYRLTVELPAGTSQNVTIMDALPRGLAFIDDSSATLSFVSDTPGSIVSTIGAGVLPDAAVSASSTSDVDAYGNGTDVWFSLGDFVNTEVDADLEYAVVEFNAVVVNEAYVTAGRTLTNTATLFLDGVELADITPTTDHQVRVVEPNLSVPAKTVRMGSGAYVETAIADAGDVVDFRITFQNNNGTYDADAFDVHLRDVLPDDIDLDTTSVEVYIDGILQTPGTDYIDATDAATDTIDLTLARLNTGQTVEVRYSATLLIGVSPNETLTNTVSIDYSSLPGGFGTAVSAPVAPTSNQTGSDLATLNGPAYATDSGDLFGERNGQLNGTSPNTYFVQDTANVRVDRVGSITKTLVGTSINDGSGAANNTNVEAVIGEIATYTVTVDLNEGTLPNAQLIDTMDPGLSFLGVTSVSVNGVTYDSGADLMNPTVSLASRRLTWDFGTIVDTTPGDASTTGDSDGQISITYDVVVTNHSWNYHGRPRDNGAVFSYDDDPSTAPNPRDSISVRSTGIRIIEPTVAIDKSVALDTDGDGSFDDGQAGDAGDQVQYRITLANPSDVDAFDLEFSDALPTIGGASAILAPTFTVTDSSTTDPVSASDFELVGSDATGWTLQKKSTFDFDMLGSQRHGGGGRRVITFTIEGTIASSVTPNLVVSNTAEVEWESWDGDYVGPSPHTTLDVERTGADGPGGALNDYAAESTDAFTISRPVFTKDLMYTDRYETSGSNVTIGETVTYALYVSLPEGVTPDATIVDQLPPGLEYVSHQFVTTVAGSLDASGFYRLWSDFNGTITGGAPVVTGGSAAGEDVTFTFGEIVVDVNNDPNDNAFMILIDARVVDTPTTHGYVGNQTVLQNTATIDLSTDTLGPQSVPTPVDVTVEEPSLNITKEFGPTVNTDLADAGDFVTINLTVDNNQGTSAAYDVVVTDVLNPAHYDLSTVDLGTAGADYPADFTVSFNSTTGEVTYSGGDIDEGDTVRFQIGVQLLESVVPNQTLLNTATITDASTLDGTVAGERNLPDADGDGSDTDTDTVRIRRNSLAGFIFDDIDNDGLREAGENGLAGIDVRIVGTDHLGNAVVVNTQTLADGSYLFDNLRAGTYSIIQDPNGTSIPAGYLDGDETAGTAGGDISVDDQIQNISLPAGQETHSTGNHFAEIQDSDLSGFVYHDADNNGAFNGTETGISGIQIQLSGTDDRGQAVSITVATAANGGYTFTGLRPSDANGYTITQLTEPAGYLDGRDTDGSLNNGDASSVNNVISSINVVPGVSGTSYNFGELIPSTLSGYVYHDSDNDGQRTDEPAANGIAGSTITLTGTDDLGNAVNETTATDANGYFEFTGLRPSSAAGYVLTQTTAPAAYIDGRDTAGSPGGNTSVNDTISQIVVVSNTTGTEHNFGELLPASLAGQVFNDHDNDGTFDPADGETPIEGTTIRLTGTDDLGNAVDITLQTDANGNYEFTNLRPSDAAGYSITETQPAEYLDGSETDGSLNNGSTATNDVISSINVSSGDAGTGYTFGNQGSTISGQVFVDDDRDGNLDAGETTGIAGVTVELFDLSDPANPVSLGTTTTDATGQYAFDYLPAGDYRIVQTQPEEYGTVSSNTIDVTLPLGGLPTTHFAEALYDLGDVIYFDANADGVQNAAEQGIANVDVTLTFAGFDGIFGTADDPASTTTTTDANGEYRFDELFVGNYRITVDAADLPDGVSGTDESDDASFGAASIDGTANVEISSSDRFDVDFGYTGDSTIAGFVWTDISGEGAQDADEPGLADITVNLIFAGNDGIFGNADDLTLTTSTASDGTYSFANLPAGDFQISVDTNDTDLPGSLSGVTGPDSIAGTASVSLTAGETNADVDFGFAGERTIGNQFWLDTDGNGTQNGNEPGLPDVSVTLLWFGQDGAAGTADDVTLNTVTDSSGNYSFNVLPDGNYRVTYDTATLPAAVSATHEVDGSLDGQGNFVVNGTDRTDVDFGFRGTGSIGDFVWLDTDADAQQDAGEPGLANITVQLLFAGIDGDFTTTDDNININTVTDASGAYQFAGLADGNYRVRVDVTDTDLPGSLTPVSGTDSHSGIVDVVLDAASRNVDTVDFGFAGTRSIGETIWLDLDGDGTQTADEPGLGDVDVTLLFAGQDGIFGTADDVTQQTTTDANGDFTFTDLPDGDYQVSVDTTDLPAGVSPTSDVDGTLDNQANFTIGGSDRSDINFGYRGERTIGDVVFNDANANAIQDAGEPGIAAVDMTLTAAGNDGIFGTADDFVLTTATDASGNFAFSQLPEGDYQITYDASDLPAGMTIGTVETDDSSPSIDGTANITVGATDRLDIDFGFTGDDRLGDYVFFDANADGAIDAGDQGLGNVQVSLLFAGQDGAFGTADDVLRTTTTAADGSYHFNNLANGDHRVFIDLADLPAGLTQTMEGDGSANNLFEVTINNDGVDTADFGFAGTSSIGDSVWLDADGDGVRDPEDHGLADITVNLVFAGADGVFGSADDFSLTTETDSNGNYQLANLPAGDFQVSVDTSDTDLPGSIVGVSGSDSIAGTAAVTLTPGEANSSTNFAFAGTQPLGDRIWFDANGDGIQDATNEPGLAGVDVVLTFAGQDNTFGTADDFTKSTTTSAIGEYQFTTLPDGDYQIAVQPSSLPTGSVATFEVDDAAFATALDDTARVTINGSNRSDVDFGYRGGLSLGDTFFHDTNGDGIQDASEPGIAGVDITATFAGQDGIFGNADDFAITTTTDATGNFVFESLFEGEYQVSFDATDLPSGMNVPTTETDDSNAAMDGVSHVTLTTNRSDLDFGFRGNQVIGDRVWLDTNGDGIQDATNEPGLGNVDVQLLFAGPNGIFGDVDDATLSTTTAADGSYQFTGLPDGDYRVSFDISGLPANVTQTFEADGSPNNNAEISVTGTDRTDVDFGVRGSRTVGDSVWFDANGNGLQDAGEPGLAGVQIDLLFAGNDGDFSTTDDNFVLSTTTDANGNFEFASLPDGNYELTVQTSDLPTGMQTITAETDDVTPAFDGTSRITVAGNRDDVDFGYHGTSVIESTVFFDENGDGIQNGPEVGIPDVTVTIEIDFTGDGVPDFTTTAVTDSDGSYSFENLPEGEVTITVTDPAGTIPTTDHNGDGTGDNVNEVSIGTGSTDDSSTFGYSGTGTIGDTVYFDANADDQQNDGSGAAPAEPGLPGVQVFLDIDFNADGTIDRTLETTTDSAGQYSFGQLPAGQYTVRVTQPAGTSPTDDADGVASANQSSLSLRPNLTVDDQDFGYVGTGTISDSVFFDIDGDGIKEVGTDDRGIENVDVTIGIDVNGDGSIDFTQTTQTDANGDFTFQNLIPGRYVITTDPADMPVGLANNPTVDNDGIATPHESAYDVTPDGTISGPGFGFHATPDYDITKTGSFASARPGDTVNYTIVVRNIGELDGRNITVTDTFPNDILQITDADGGTLDAAAGTITWDLAALQPAEQQILTVTAVVRNPVASGLEDFTNSVEVTDDQFNGIDPDSSNNSDSWTADLEAEPDYAITKTNGSNSPLRPGDQTTYTITVTNNGDQDGTGVVITDRFPVGVLSVANADGGTVDVVNGTITWNLASLEAGNSVIFQPVFDVVTPANAAQEEISNAADVTDDGSNGTDPNPADNTSSDTDTLTAVPDYRISKWITGTPSEVYAGSTITYSILVENVGDQDGNGVIVTDTYPTVALENVTASGATVDASTGTITWNLGDLAGGGESVLLTVTARVRTDLPSGLHNLVNSVEVTDDLSNGPDPTPGDNEGSDTTFIQATPNLTIQKSDADAEDVRPGETVWYTISYANMGTQDADNIVITETIPEGSIFNAAESSAGWVDQGDGTVTYEISSLATSETGELTFAVDVSEILDPNREELVNVVTIRDDGLNGPDSNPADNVGTDETPLQVYTFDSFEDFSGNANDLEEFDDSHAGQPFNDPNRNRLAALPIDTVYTGVVDPGATVSGKIYDEHGRMIGEQTVMADGAGNWLMQFPTVVLNETPHSMQIQQTQSVQSDPFEAGFNLRRFFHPAVHSQVFMTTQLDVGTAYFHSPWNVLEAMHEANTNPLAFGWATHNYELVISSTNVAAL